MCANSFAEDADFGGVAAFAFDIHGEVFEVLDQLFEVLRLDLRKRDRHAMLAQRFIELVVGLVTIGSVKRAIQKAYPRYTASQIHRLEVADIFIAVIVGVIAIGLWLWMARANSRGKNWARITSTVLFAIETLSVLEALRGPKTAVGLIFPVLTWLVGLGAVWFLWRPESTAFFKTPQYG